MTVVNVFLFLGRGWMSCFIYVFDHVYANVFLYLPETDGLSEDILQIYKIFQGLSCTELLFVRTLAPFSLCTSLQAPSTFF